MKSETKLIARYAETDQMGIIHHSVYPVWFEAARTDFIKSFGLSYSELEQQGVMLPLSGLCCHYHRPGHYEDEITVVTAIEKLTAATLTLRYEVFNQHGELLCDGTTTHGWTDLSLKPISLRHRLPHLFAAMQQARKEEAHA